MGELDARRAKDLAESIFWRTDPFEEVTAEVSAAQNISRARASGQIRYARALRDNLPAVMAEFATGAIDFRMIATIITRTENVDATVMPLLDEALARHAVKWMRLSEPKLRDRIDLWVTMFDPPGCGCRPRSTTTAMSRLSRPVRGWPGSGPTFTPPTPRLDALASKVCDTDPRTREQRRADACGPLARLEDQLECQCGAPDCPAVAERNAAAAAVIHVLAEQATLDGHTHQTCGGRSLNDDVIDKLLTLLVNGGKGPRVSDGVDRPATPVSDVFPYQAPPTSQPRAKQGLDLAIGQASK